ncbi:TauD/TfdA family dioxygenase [Rhodoferax sp.]|uniref:TauD/TfdA family dioxygenase n=1 Tax=Rhodoferax sp. TaxID=50421 RepID=UPI003BB605D2
MKHHVLFFENQPITPQQQRDLAARFGELHIHPIYPHVADVPEIIVLDTSSDNWPDNDNWHTDVTFVENPPMGALLSAKLLPLSGGDTLWASGAPLCAHPRGARALGSCQAEESPGDAPRGAHASGARSPGLVCQ